jgi:hypothetical protein
VFCNQDRVDTSRAAQASSFGSFCRLIRQEMPKAAWCAGSDKTTMPRLALSMIVKNAADDLPECLGSVAGAADEIVVADTDSSDDSIEIARRAGAKTLSIPGKMTMRKREIFRWSRSHRIGC